MDTTPVSVLGVENDSLILDRIICPGADLVLDASTFGSEFLWGDGSTDAQLIVESEGNYDLVVFNGCEPSYVFFKVKLGKNITIEAPNHFDIHLGESVVLEPIILNEGVELTTLWEDPTENSLSCLNCMITEANPLFHTSYLFKASNEDCIDSTYFKVFVDNSRRIFAPNVFSPNFDGLNDYFFLQSPDFGIIHSFKIFNRWGDLVFKSTTSLMNDHSGGWDGKIGTNKAQEGVYLWEAEIKFLDGLTEIFYGDVSILK